MSLFPRRGRPFRASPSFVGAALACAALVGAAVAFAGPALADQATGAACAQTLPPEAMTIYRAVAPTVTPATDLRSLLRTKVKAMVIGGQVQRSSARSSAYAAYNCLKELK